jgi:NADH-quinone oxidoreductase subunit N
MEFPIIDMAIVAPMFTVFGWATVLLLVDLFAVADDNKRVTGYLAIAGLVVTGVVAVLVGARGGVPATTDGMPFDGMVVHDNFALFLTVLFVVVGIISIAISLDYLPRQGIEQGEYYPLMMFAVGGMMLLAQSTDLIMLFLGVELLSITLYILTAFAYPRQTSEEAAMKYLLLGAFASGFLVYGIALLYGATGTVNLIEIGRQAELSRMTEHEILLLAGGGLVLVAFGFKVALVPFHMWTPDVYEGAPTPVTAFMSVGTKAAAFAALLRVLLVAMPSLEQFWVPVIGGMAVLTMLVGNVGALSQTNVKRMLAYSSVAHAGYIVLGVMAAIEPGSRGVEAFLFYLVAYAFSNLGAFAVIIALEQRGEAAWSLDDFSGLWKRQPALALSMAVFLLSLAGVPPTAGFVGKFYLFTAAWQSGLWLLVLVGLLTSALAVFFYLRIIVRMFMEEPVREVQPLLFRGVSVSIVIAVVGTIVFGLLPTPIIALVERSVSTAVGGM